MGKVIDLTGFKIDTLEVLERKQNNKHNRAVWLCRCFCGKKFTTEGLQINSGKTKSCGCLNHFKKGYEPYNKGMKRGSVSEKTEFKKGDTPQNFKGIGTPRVVGSRKEVVATINETETRTRRGKTYTVKKRTSYARYLWMENIGEIPKGMVIYNHGSKEDIQLENLEIITRAELVKRNAKRG